MVKSAVLVSILGGCIFFYGYALDNPDSLYSTGLAGAKPHKDPHGQMKNFLGIIWNFLPENAQIQKRVKIKYAKTYEDKFGEPPTEINYNIPPTANMKKICAQEIQKSCKNQEKLEKEKKNLTKNLHEQQTTILQLKSQLSTLGLDCAKTKAELEKTKETLTAERNQCQHDINAIQEGYGTLVAYRDDFKAKEKELNENLTAYLELQSQQCLQTEDSQCKEEVEKELFQKAAFITELLPQLEKSAAKLHDALLTTVNLDLAVPVEAKVIIRSGGKEETIPYKPEIIRYTISAYAPKEGTPKD